MENSSINLFNDLKLNNIKIKLEDISLPTENKEKKSKFNNGRWSEEEHKNFLLGIIEYGNKWKRVQNIIKTRSSTQARSHAQKFFLRIKRDFKFNDDNNNLIFNNIKNIEMLKQDNFSIKFFFELLNNYDNNQSNIELGKLDKDQKEKLYNFLIHFSIKGKYKTKEKFENNNLVSCGNKIIIKNIDLNELNEYDNITGKNENKIFNIIKDKSRRETINLTNSSKKSNSTLSESDNNNVNSLKRKNDKNNFDLEFNNYLENSICDCSKKGNPFEINFELLSQTSNINHIEKEDNNSFLDFNDY